MKSRFLLLMASCLLWAGVALAQININTASEAELDSLKGIGKARAEAIIKYRSEHGPFKSVNDLKNIPNFPDNLVSKLRGQITVGGATRSSSAAEAPKPMALPPARPLARSNPEPARPAAPAMPGKSAPAPAPVAAEKPAVPMAPAKPAMPGKPAVDSKPAAVPAAVTERPAAPAAPARPAMPGKVTSEAKPAAPAAPAAKPAGPAMPATPAKPAAPARPAMPAAN
jgi:competence protein ComEA